MSNWYRPYATRYDSGDYFTGSREGDSELRRRQDVNTLPKDTPRYFVQGETVHGEPRIHFVSDRLGKRYASEVTRDERQARRWCDKMNAGVVPSK